MLRTIDPDTMPVGWVSELHPPVSGAIFVGISNGNQYRDMDFSVFPFGRRRHQLLSTTFSISGFLVAESIGNLI